MHSRGLQLRDFASDTVLAQWFLIFTEVEEVSWWDRWLKPGFRHCYAMRWDGYNWLIVNPRPDILEVEISAVVEHNQRDAAIGEATAVVLVSAMVPRLKHRRLIPLGPITCVEVVKALVGIRGRWIFTPWQLYRHVRHANG